MRRRLIRLAIMLGLLIALVPDSPAKTFLPGDTLELKEFLTDPFSRPEVFPRAVPDSTADRLRASRTFRYANDPEFGKRPEQEEPGRWLQWIQWLNGSGVMRWMLYGFLVLILCFAAYQFVAGNPFSRPGKKGTSGRRQDAEDQDAPLPPDLNRAIAEAERRGAYRAATRFLFLRTLEELASRGKIKTGPALTNAEYLRQFQNHPEASAFRQALWVYEYVWYGSHEPDAAQYRAIRQTFEPFVPR